MRVSRFARIAFCVLVTAAVSGCLQSSTVIKMKPDGSGTIEQTTTMNAEAVAQFSSLAAMGNDKDKKGNPVDELFSEKDARAAAAKMGQGVTFVSSQKIDTADRKGLKAIYAFTDIGAMRLEEMNAPGGMNDSGMTPGAKKDPPITFQFKQLPGGNGLLTILQPGVDKVDKPSSTPPVAPGATAAVDPKMAEQGLEMMKTFMKGLKVDIVVQVPRLVKTNSAYVQGGTVTLLSMDFDQVLSDPDALKKMNDAKSLDDTKALLKGVKGIKVNLEPQLTIEFAGK